MGKDDTITMALNSLSKQLNTANLNDKEKNAVQSLIEKVLAYYTKKRDSISKKSNNRKHLFKMYSLMSKVTEYIVKINDIVEGRRDIFTTIKRENVYVVKQGDSLYSISRKYGMNVKELISMNNLTNNVIVPNQKIKVVTTVDQNNYETYTVKENDDLYSIASKYNVNVNDLIAYNGLSTTTLIAGSVIRIPVNLREDVFYVTNTILREMNNSETLNKIKMKRLFNK